MNNLFKFAMFWFLGDVLFEDIFHPAADTICDHFSDKFFSQKRFQIVYAAREKWNPSCWTIFYELR